MTYLRLDPDPLRPPEDKPPDQPRLRWRLWWRFGFRPIIAVIRILPIADWRKDDWVWRVDGWAMGHLA